MARLSQISITDSYSLFGSYNLTVNLHCKNGESCYMAGSVQEEKDAFDLHWNALDSSQVISHVCSGTLSQ